MMRPIELPAKASRPQSFNPGPAPMLQWVKIADLVVDESYQRELGMGNWRAIRKIAEQFLWSRFSPVFAAPIEGGKYAVIDGQHRTHAAALCGFSEVPCQIVTMSREEQASAFAAVNGIVTKVTTWQLFKAAHSAGEAWAKELDAVAAAAGCKAMFRNGSTTDKQPGEIYAISGLRKIITTFGPEKVTKALAALRKAEGFKDETAAWDALIVLNFLHVLCERPAILDNPMIVDVIGDFDFWAALDKISETTKQRRAMGRISTSKKEQFRQRLSAYLDRAFTGEKP